MKYVKSCLPKGNLLDTTILLIFVYWWNSYSSISVSSSLIIFMIFYKFLIFLNNFVDL